MRKSEIPNIADGFSILIASHLTGDPVPERIAGIELLENARQLANNNNYGVFFLGARPEILTKVIDKCMAKYPGINIVGHHHGYFKDCEVDVVVNEIAASNADILFIALGLPQKEYFIHDHVNRFNVGVVLPVGGSFDVFAGTKKRAPQFVRKYGIEWLWRSFYDLSRMKLVFKSLILYILILCREIYNQRILRRERRIK